MCTFGSVKKSICKSFIFCLNIFFLQNNFSFLRIRFKTNEDIRQKYESLHTSVFQIHFAFSFKSFIFSLRRYFGRNVRFVQLNLKFLQPFGSFCVHSSKIQNVHQKPTQTFFHADRSVSIIIKFRCTYLNLKNMTSDMEIMTNERQNSAMVTQM